MFGVRRPAAAGVFYNSEKNGLLREIELSFKHKTGPRGIKSRNPIAIVAPHDRYHLSGPVAAWSYSAVEQTNYIIIGSNHNNLGSEFSVMKEGLWKTPLGEIVVSSHMAQKIIDKSKIVEYDVVAHENEHSIEVQLPFLQYRFGNDFKFVPLAIMNSYANEDFMKRCILVGKAIANSIRNDKDRWTIIATSDLSHNSKDVSKKIDRDLINSMKNLSERKLFQRTVEHNAHICGLGALITAMSAAKEIGAKKSKLLKYSNSFAIIRDPNSVTGYASLIIY